MVAVHLDRELVILKGRYHPVYQFEPKTKAVFAKAVAKAERTTNETLPLKTCHCNVDGGWRFF